MCMRNIVASGSAVYLFNIKHLTTTSDYFIAKYGFSIDLKRRSKEHTRLYGPSIMLVNKSLVEPRYLREAEWDLKRKFAKAEMHAGPQLLACHNVPRGNCSRELIIVPNDASALAWIDDIYREIEEKFMF